MILTAALAARAGSKCELCGGTADLGAYDVQPNAGPSVDTAALLCATCRSGVESPASSGSHHWHALRESVWSEHAPVKVLTYRVLKRLGDDALAQELLGQIYLEDDQQAWADAGLATDEDAGASETRDGNGTVLAEGDTVTLIKDLEVKGANFTAKRGTTVKGINLTNDPKYVEGKVNGIRIVLIAAFLKKA